MGAMTFVVVTAVTFDYRNEIRWMTLRNYYVAKLAAEPLNSNGFRSIVWAARFDWQVDLEYHDTDTDARAWQQKQKEWHPSYRQKLV
jgi:hypothetical protein